MAYCGDSLEFGVGVRGEVEGFDLFVEGGFARIVKAEEEDGVFYGRVVRCLENSKKKKKEF